MNKVTCCLLTYNRIEYAVSTLVAFYDKTNPKPPLHIADDGSPGDYVDKLTKLARRAGAPSVSFSNSQHKGYGANVNLASQLTHISSEYVFMLEDDWELRKPLDLSEYVEDMEALPAIDCIRLGYLSWTQPLAGTLACGPNRKYIMLDSNSPEPHVWAGHPRLERVSYQREVGLWPEGLDPNQTEFAVAHFRRARCGVAWPLGLDGREGYGLFAHVGTVRAR